MSPSLLASKLNTAHVDIVAGTVQRDAGTSPDDFWAHKWHL